MGEAKQTRSALQDWVMELSLMQQSVLISGIRGPDGVAKGHICKPLIRWFRRCVLISAFDKCALTDPLTEGGGSFTGPAYEGDGLEDIIEYFYGASTNYDPADLRDKVLDHIGGLFMKSRDELPFHYFTHFMHAVEIIGYKHPNLEIRKWWYNFYIRMVSALHMFPETEEQMDARLGDNKEGWLARSDEDGSCST